MSEETAGWYEAHPWGISIGWLSRKYSPQSGNPDVWHVDEFELTDEFAKDPARYGTQVSSDPHHQEGPGPTVHAKRDFDLDPAWREWFAKHLHGDNDFFLMVEDRDDLLFEHQRRWWRRRWWSTCYAPVDLYLGLKNERDVSRELFRGLYAYAAQKRGWPEPPPLPPYHDA